MWTHYDKDGSGYLERKELDNFLVDLIVNQYGTQPSGDELAELRGAVLQQVDANRDGKIELGEFASMLPLEENFLRRFGTRKTLSRKHFNDIFMHYDPDGNGFIEGKELTALIRDIMTRSKEEVSIKDVEDYKEAVLSVFDKNTDGRLSRRELGLLLSIEI